MFGGLFVITYSQAASTTWALNVKPISTLLEALFVGTFAIYLLIYFVELRLLILSDNLLRKHALFVRESE